MPDSTTPHTLKRQRIRASVDAKLGRGFELSVDEAWDRLTSVERVEWMLGELFVSLVDHRFHLWIQRYADAETSPSDWPGRLAGLVADAPGDDVSDRLRWTAHRVAEVRGSGRGEPLVSVVPWVWMPIREQLTPWLEHRVGSWPEHRQLVAATPRARSVRPPRSTPPFYPVVPTIRSNGSPREAVVAGVIDALFRAGAPNDTLDRAFEDLGDASLVEAACRWVHLGEGDETVVDALRCRLDPLRHRYGIDENAAMLVVAVGTQIAPDLLAEFPGAVELEGDAPTYTIAVRAAIRCGASALVVRGPTVPQGVHELLCQAVMTGMALILVDVDDALLIDALKALGVVVQRAAALA